MFVAAVALQTCSLMTVITQMKKADTCSLMSHDHLQPERNPICLFLMSKHIVCMQVSLIHD